jgi:hypothetical protein
VLTRFWWRELGKGDRLEDPGIDNIKINIKESGEDNILEDREKLRNFTYVVTNIRGTRWHSWLRHCAISRKVACSIPDGVTGIFH